MVAAAEKSRTPLPAGTVPVGLSLLVSGFATFAFFRVGEWAVGSKHDFAPLASMWFALFALAPGFFLPLEQELGRAISERRQLGLGARPVVMRVAQIGAIITAVVVVLIVLAGPLISDSYFGGNWKMVVALALAFAAYAPSLVARGVTAGMGRFWAYAVVISLDGVIRVLVCVVLAGVGWASVVALGFAVAAAPLVPFTIVAARGQLHTEPGPPAAFRDVSHHLGWLLLGSVCSAALINSGPVLTNLLSEPGEDALVTIFGQGLLIARVPLFLFQAVQAALLPRLARLAAAGDFAEFRRGFRALMVLVAGVGVIGTIGGYVIGPQVVRLVYDADLTGRDIALLALASALIMGAIATAQAVIALRGYEWVAAGWIAGIVALAAGTWLSSNDLFLRVETGFVLAGATALAALLLALRRQLRRRVPVFALG